MSVGHERDYAKAIRRRLAESLASYGPREFTKFVDGCSRSTTANSRETAFFTTGMGPFGIGAAIPLAFIGEVSRGVFAGTLGDLLRWCQGKLRLAIPMAALGGLTAPSKGLGRINADRPMARALGC